MQETHNPMQHDEDTISLLDIVQFIQESYKNIILLGLGGLIAALVFTFGLGQYTATITLLNSAELDIPRIKYLQAALPKLAQEGSNTAKDTFLDSEALWKSAIRINSLIGKSDAKDVLDPASLKTDRFNIYALEIIGKARAKQSAQDRVQEMSNFFVNGTVYIDLRDLLRQYELNVTTTNAKLGTKILNAEVELAYIDRRINNLKQLQKQFPGSVGNQGGPSQLTDAKDGGAKFLPIMTQIIAATADQNNQKELLQRYKEEAAQMRIYALFIEKAKPSMDLGLTDPALLSNLLEIVSQAKQEVSTNYEKVTLSTIEGDLKKIMGLKLYGLPQVGSVDVRYPPYLKNTAIGLFGGLLIGLLLGLGRRVLQRLRVEMKTPAQ